MERVKEYCVLCTEKRLDRCKSIKVTEQVVERINIFREKFHHANNHIIVAGEKVCEPCYLKVRKFNPTAESSQLGNVPFVPIIDTRQPFSQFILPMPIAQPPRHLIASPSTAIHSGHHASQLKYQAPRRETASKSTSTPQFDMPSTSHSGPSSSRQLFPPQSGIEPKITRQLSDESSTTSSDSSNKDPSYSKKITPQKRQRIELNFPRISHNTKCCAISPHKKLAKTNQVTIPEAAINQLFLARGIIVPDGMKCHEHHIKDGLFTDDALKTFRVASNTSSMTKQQIEKYMKTLRERAKNANLGLFKDTKSIRENDLIAYTGLNREQFEILLYSVKGKIYESENRTVSQVIAIYLHHIKTGLSYNNIAGEFNLNKYQVGRWIKSAREALYENFVNKYLGVYAYSMADHLEEQSKIASELFKCENKELLVVMDGNIIIFLF